MERIRSESGFTLVEVLVASVLLLIGLARTVSVVDVANGRTTVTQGQRPPRTSCARSSRRRPRRRTTR